MRKRKKQVLAIFCILTMLGNMVFTGGYQTVKAENTSVPARETQVVSYSDATPKVAPKNIPEGYLFAGWYKDQACSEVLMVAGTGYAKFVDENVLRVKAQIKADATAVKETMDLRFATTVDSLRYQNVGFEITINGNTRTFPSSTVYSQLYVVGDTTGTLLPVTPQESFCASSAYFNTRTIEGIPNVSFGTGIKVRAYWTTLDGTVVYGETIKKTVNMGIFRTEAVDYGMILDCDNRDYLIDASAAVRVTTEEYQEGAGALELEHTNQKAFLLQFDRGKAGIDISEYSDGYLHFWLYVNDTEALNGSSMTAVLSSSGTEDAEELQWTLPSLNTGWNDVKLNFSAAEKNGGMDYENVNYFSLSGSGVCETGLMIRLDDVRAVASGQLFSCDNMDYYRKGEGTATLTVDEYKEGSAAIQHAGPGDTWYQFVRAGVSADISQYADGRLHFWLYISRVDELSTGNVIVELGSGASSGTESLQWHVPTLELNNGWNEITLPIAAPDTSCGSIDLSKVDYFRIYHATDDTSVVSDAGIATASAEYTATAGELTDGVAGGTNNGSWSEWKNLTVILDDVRVMENQAQILQTLYDTEDIAIADIIPTEMGYAVDPTGQTDSSQGLQEALNDCSAAGGGTVYLPAGTYVISQSIDIPSYVTLRGDWRDPDDTDETGYGTFISVTMEPVDSTTAEESGVFNLHGISGAVGLTVYYPNQSLSSVKIYPHTFYVVEGMLPTVRNVTVINGYSGIGATAGSHESLQIDHFRGTFLKTGIQLYTSSDVGTGKNITISNKYWKQYDNSINESTLDSYTKAHTVGCMLGDVEWSEFTNVSIEGCNIGVQTVEGKRSSVEIWFAGSFYDLQISNCTYGVQADYLDVRWGMNIARSSIKNCTTGVRNNTAGTIQLCNVDFTGTTTATSKKWFSGGTIAEDNTDLSGRVIDHTASYVTPSARMIVANLSEEKDASTKLQDCLDWMYRAGGGVVYVPSGIYSFYQPVTVPAGVELRGSSTVATRDQWTGECHGTLFRCYYGDEGRGDVAFITLAGEYAGLNGVRIIYANNACRTNVSTNKTLETTYAVQGKAKGVYFVNSMISGAAYGVDFRDCDNHYIKGVNTCCYYVTYCLGGTDGIITDCLQNPTVYQRTVSPVSPTWGGHEIFGGLCYGITKRDNHNVVLENATNQLVYNVFAYGSLTMITNIDSTGTLAVNIGTDKVGASSAQIVMDGGSLFGVNILRSNTTAEEATNTSQDGKYVPAGVSSKLYRYIDGSLELRNNLLMELESGDEANEDPVIIADTQETATTSKPIINCDTTGNMTVLSEGTFGVTTTAGEYVEGSGAFKTSGAGEVRFEAILNTAVNVKSYKKSQLHISLYVNDKSNFTSNTPVYIEVGSARRCDTEELQWEIPLRQLKAGWNDLVLNLEEAVADEVVHLGAIDYIRVYHSGNTNALVTIVDNVYVKMPGTELEDGSTGGQNTSDWGGWFQ